MSKATNSVAGMCFCAGVYVERGANTRPAGAAGTRAHRVGTETTAGAGGSRHHSQVIDRLVCLYDVTPHPSKHQPAVLYRMLACACLLTSRFLLLYCPLPTVSFRAPLPAPHHGHLPRAPTPTPPGAAGRAAAKAS